MELRGFEPLTSSMRTKKSISLSFGPISFSNRKGAEEVKCRLQSQ